MVKVNAEKILSVELPDVLKPKKITTTFWNVAFLQQCSYNQSSPLQSALPAQEGFMLHSAALGGDFFPSPFSSSFQHAGRDLSSQSKSKLENNSSIHVWLHYYRHNFWDYTNIYLGTQKTSSSLLLFYSCLLTTFKAIFQLLTFLHGKSCSSPTPAYTAAFLICWRAHFLLFVSRHSYTADPNKERAGDSYDFLVSIYIGSRIYASALEKSLLFTIHGSTQSLAGHVGFSILSHTQG